MNGVNERSPLGDFHVILFCLDLAIFMIVTLPRQ